MTLESSIYESALVIHKDIAFLASLEKIILATGVKYIFHADSGEKALELLDQFGADVIFLDSCFVDEYFEKIVSISSPYQSFESIPIIVLKFDEEECKLSHPRFSGFLDKPVSQRNVKTLLSFLYSNEFFDSSSVHESNNEDQEDSLSKSLNREDLNVLLCIESNIALHFALKTMLASCGVDSVCSANSNEDLTELLTDSDFDIVFLDENLVDEKNEKFLKEISLENDNIEKRVVIITSKQSTSIVASMTDNPNIHNLIFPISKYDLEELLE